MLKGFKDFIMRGNVVDLAVGVTIGAAFTALVTSFSDSFLKPLISAIGTSDVPGTVDLGNKNLITYGAFFSAVIGFLMTALVVYFLVVLPMNKLAERRRKGEEPPPAAPSEEIKLLTEIRDALLAGRGVAPAQAPAQRDAPDPAEKNQTAR
ncbi:MAG TPA: large conductance mechanosensitive channel protein MscL [Candidatus Limnocylindrales bacterium]